VNICFTRGKYDPLTVVKLVLDDLKPTNSRKKTFFFGFHQQSVDMKNIVTKIFPIEVDVHPNAADNINAIINLTVFFFVLALCNLIPRSPGS